MLTLWLFVAELAQAADAPDWLANTLHESGKMNTVLAVVLVLLAAIFVWMFILDRRINKLEK